MIDEKIESFLKEGIVSKYAETWETLYLFEKELKKKLKESVAQPGVFSEFQIDLDPRDIKFKTEGARRERYIWTIVTGNIRGEKVKMDAGIWWNSGEFEEPVVCYANFKNRFFKPSNLPKAIKFKNNEYHTRLYVVPGADFDPVRDFSGLIQELQRQVVESDKFSDKA